MLIDVHAHFYTARSNRADWDALNRNRLTWGGKAGITAHVASILGTWGAGSPTYFPSPEDVSHANEAMLAMQRQHKEVFGYCVVNPNFTEHGLEELESRVGAGMVGLKLAASRRADDHLLDPFADLAGRLNVPVLHHVWQHRQRDWPGQEASDATELASLARAHPGTRFILAHLGGGGDWYHSLRAVRDVPNIWVDISGSGVDGEMLHAAMQSVGTARMLWGSDLTMDTGMAKLAFLETLGMASDDLERITFGNAMAVFPPGTFQ